MGRNFAPSPKVKGPFLGICLVYDMFIAVLLFAPLLTMFFVKPVFSRYFRKFLVTTLSAEMTKGCVCVCVCVCVCARVHVFSWPNYYYYYYYCYYTSCRSVH